MATQRAKSFEFAAAIDRAGRVSADDGPPLEVPESWTPEHLVLAGLLRCAHASLAYHAGRGGLQSGAHATASGTVTRREEDGRFAFVEIDVRAQVELDPLPPPEDVRILLDRTERDCFVSASLRAAPRFHWRVNRADR